MAGDRGDEPLARGLPPRYRVTRVLGQGAFGAVLEAEDLELSRPVAIKILYRARPSPESLERLRREAQVTARLKHPGIVTVYDAGATADGAPYVVYERVEGTDLGELVEAGGIASLDRLAGIGARIAEALAAAHRDGVLHRDVKPRNVLVRADGAVLLCDFGLAGWDGEGSGLTGTGEQLGTPRYMAPELWEGRMPSPASDQFAWAASLFELAYGVPAMADGVAVRLAGGKPLKLLNRIPAEAAGRWPELEAALARALDPDPAQRFPSMEVFGAVLARLALSASERGPSPLRPPGSRLPSGRVDKKEKKEPDRGRGRGLPAGAVAGALALALGAGLLAGRRAAPGEVGEPGSASPPGFPEPAAEPAPERAELEAVYRELARGHQAKDAEPGPPEWLGDGLPPSRAHLVRVQDFYFDARTPRIFARFMRAAEAWIRARRGPADPAAGARAMRVWEEVLFGFAGHLADDAREIYLLASGDLIAMGSGDAGTLDPRHRTPEARAILDESRLEIGEVLARLADQPGGPGPEERILRGILVGTSLQARTESELEELHRYWKARPGDPLGSWFLRAELGHLQGDFTARMVGAPLRDRVLFEGPALLAKTRPPAPPGRVARLLAGLAFEAFESLGLLGAEGPGPGAGPGIARFEVCFEAAARAAAAAGEPDLTRRLAAACRRLQVESALGVAPELLAALDRLEGPRAR